MLPVTGSIQPLVAGLTTALALAVAACGTGQQHRSGGAAAAPSHMSPGMQMLDPNAGRSSSEHGYTFDSRVSSLPASGDRGYRFRVLGPEGKAVTSFIADQTKLMHLYAVRADLTGYQHLHPVMATDGTWSVDLPLTAPGPYRVYASFIARDSAGQEHALVLSRQVTVPGGYQPATLPVASDSTDVDGYTVSFGGPPMSAMAMPLRARITRAGQPTTDLQPYLDSYAHLTAFRSGDMAFAHLHPKETASPGKNGGPDLSFHAELPGNGSYRLFLQFQTGGQLHTAALTMPIG